MAKTSINFNISRATLQVKTVFDKVRKNQQMLNEVGTVVVKRLQGEARRKKPLNNEGSFPDLKDSTIANRRRLKKRNKTHKTYSDRRSNLTFTGQLIDAITFKRLKAAVKIFVDNNARKMYTTGKDGNKAKASRHNRTNIRLDATLRKIGFKLFDAKAVEKSKVLRKRINSIVKRTLRRALKVQNR